MLVPLTHASHLLCTFLKRRRLWASGLLKEADPCFKIVCNVSGGLLLGDAFGLNIDERLPETRSPDSKPDEPGLALHRVPAHRGESVIPNPVKHSVFA